MSDLKRNFGKRVRELRKSAGFTQEKLAELIDFEPSNISKMEKGLHFPQPEKIERIAKALHTEIYELFNFEHLKDKTELIFEVKKFAEKAHIKDLELVYKFIKNIEIYSNN